MIEAYVLCMEIGSRKTFMKLWIDGFIGWIFQKSVKVMTKYFFFLSILGRRTNEWTKADVGKCCNTLNFY